MSDDVPVGDNGTACVAKLTKELMRRSQLAQAYSTMNQPLTMP